MLNECTCQVVGIGSQAFYWRLGNTAFYGGGQQSSFFYFEINPLRRLLMNVMIVHIFISKLRLPHHFSLLRQH
jgi:hypothetical protein